MPYHTQVVMVDVQGSGTGSDADMFEAPLRQSFYPKRSQRLAKGPRAVHVGGPPVHEV